MFLKPNEFYDLRISDYKHVQKAFVNKMQTIEVYHRRSAFIIGSAASAGRVKGFENWFNSAWPFGDKKINADIAERIKDLRKQAKEGVDFLNANAAIIKRQVELARKKKASVS